MGITLKGCFPGSPSYDMGYITFWQLRKDVAYAASDELGRFVEDMPKIGHIINSKEYDDALNKYLRKHPELKSRFLDFLFRESDADGKLSPMKCKAVYDVIKDTESRKVYGYQGHPLSTCLTWGKFKSLLLECYTRQCYLVWH